MRRLPATRKGWRAGLKGLLSDADFMPSLTVAEASGISQSHPEPPKQQGFA